MYLNLKPMWVTVDIWAAWCSIPVSMSRLCTGVREEGLIYSKLCNHHGKCWRGADCGAAAELWLHSQERSGFPFRCCCNLSSALSVRHLCHEECFLWAPSSRKGKILLIMAHNSCCISIATGKLSSMFHALAMWAVKEPRGSPRRSEE